MSDLSEVPIKKDNPPAPDWMKAGVAVRHTSFGPGVITGVGLYKRYWTIFVDFEQVGPKALSTLYGTPHLHPAPDQ